MKIYAFHLLNDYSGSPKVLMQLAKAWVKNNIEVHVVTSSGKQGFLTDIKGVHSQFFHYSWAANPILRLLNLMWSQLRLIFKFFGEVSKDDIIYINTVLPFGAAFLGKLKGCRIIYHMHETSMKPPILKSFLFGIAKWAADDVIYVSRFLAGQEPFPNNTTHILYNAIEDGFLNEAIKNRKQQTNYDNVLMVCSLKDYKGVNEFAELAKNNAHFNFRLVLNAAQVEIDKYFKDVSVSSNLEIYSTQSNLHPFYQWADVILNLSWPTRWVETFGLTIIEGMAYGLPAIVPPVGGVIELVDENQNGFLVDCKQTRQLNYRLNQLLHNHHGYEVMRENSIKKIMKFNEDTFGHHSLKILDIKVKQEQAWNLVPKYGKVMI